MHILFIIGVVFVATFITTNTADAVNCCCGVQYDSSEKTKGTPTTTAECATKLLCITSPTGTACTQMYTGEGLAQPIFATAPIYQSNIENCDKLKAELEEQLCSTPSKGLLAETGPGCESYGNCSICDSIVVFTNIAKWILGVAGALALLIFIYGGFMMIISHGNPEYVEKGKKALTGTLIGLVLILGAWQMTRMVVVILVSPSSQTYKDLMQVYTDPTFNPCVDGL